MNYYLNVTLQAEEELEEAAKYLWRDNPEIADSFTDSILNFMEEYLTFMPYMFSEYKKGIRTMPYHGYVVFYEVLEEIKEVRVLHIIHGSRNFNWFRFD